MTLHLDDGDIRVHAGDCTHVMASMDAESVDAIVCDPPYALPGGFMGKAWDAMDGREDIGFAYYLSGLIDGEGTFRVGPNERRCEFAIKLRDDDRPILEAARRFMGHGRIDTQPAREGSRPQARWIIDTKDGCLALVGFLRRFPLRAKKARDAEVWCEAVGEWTGQPRGNRWHGPADRTRLRALGERIKDVREYREVPWSGHRFQDWTREWAEQALRVLKPGGHLLAFGGTRTFHRLTSGLEDAGFEIRDTLSWLYGSGFPKSLDVSKAIDKAAGAEREVVGQSERVTPRGPRTGAGFAPGGNFRWGDEHFAWDDLPPQAQEYFARRAAQRGQVTAPATDAAREWEGWGTALKPAWEPIVLARKPLTGTVAHNVQQHGTGALNIDGCRIGTDSITVNGYRAKARAMTDHRKSSIFRDGVEREPTEHTGRWPANVVLDEAAAQALDAQAGERPTSKPGQVIRRRDPDGYSSASIGAESRPAGAVMVAYGDNGGPSRFFYTAKASTSERNNGHGPANTHPTVKPVDLMRWCIRLITPPGGLVLDPFAGSGTTGVAARAEGMRAVLIEREAEYLQIIAGRLSQLSLLGGAA